MNIQAEFFDGKKASPIRGMLEITGTTICFRPDINLASDTLSYTFIDSDIHETIFLSDSIILDVKRKHEADTVRIIIKDIISQKKMKEFIRSRKVSFLRKIIRRPHEISLFKIAVIFFPALIAIIFGFNILISNSYKFVPFSFDTALGEFAYEKITQDIKICSDKDLTSALDQIKTRLSGSSERVSNIKITLIQNDDIVNAIALPGNHILFYSGLLSSSTTAEEVAGVFAHEIVHIEERHAVRQMIKIAGISFLTSVIVGGAIEEFETLEKIGEIAGTLVFLKYSKEFESEADEEGINILANSNVEIDSLIHFLEKTVINEDIEVSEDNSPEKKSDSENDTLRSIIEIFSTHPSTESRIAKINKMKEKLNYNPVPIFEKRERWNDIKSNCAQK